MAIGVDILNEWSVKDFSDLLTGVGIFVAAVLAWMKWGPGVGPRVLIKNLAFLPPGKQEGIESKNLVIAIDAIFANLSSTTEFLTDITLKIYNPLGAKHNYSAFIYAKEGFFFERDKAPNYVEALFHPIALPPSGSKEETQGISKCIILFPDKETPKFTPQVGQHKISLCVKRETAFLWRKKHTQKMTFEFSKNDAEQLTQGSDKYNKVVMLNWRLEKQTWWGRKRS